MTTGSTWLLVAGTIIGIYSVLSREAMAEFNLSDMEEMWRQRKDGKTLQAKIERFAERLDSFMFTFLLIIFMAKAAVAVSLYQLVGEALSLNGGVSHWGTFLGVFAVWLLVVDMPLRPIAAKYAEGLTLVLLNSWRLTRFILAPITAIFALVHGGMERVVRQGTGDDDEEQAEEDIMASLALGELQGQIAEHERDMIESILDMSDLTVEEVMTPRTEMHAISADEGVPGAVAMARETGHSRLPVYDGNRDNITGVLYIKDLLGMSEGTDKDLSDLVRKATFVPASKKVSELIAELRKGRVHLAVVLDEYGGTAGLVTFEDLIEVVFGEIEDEYDQEEEEEIRQLEETVWDVDGRVRVTELNEDLEINLPESENYESLGGLVTGELGCIPEVGEELRVNDYRLIVTQATDRRVVRVKIEALSEEEQIEETA